MRIGTFIVGAAVGAAAGMYFSTNRNMKSMLNQFKMMDSSQMMDKAVQFAGKTMDSMITSSSHTSASAKHANANGKHKADLGKVKEIVDKEAHLKYQVNEILSENEKQIPHQ